MNSEDLTLLENILDSLDRLFDRDSQVIDIYVLIFATAKAMADTDHFQILNKSANKLNTILKANKLDNELREAALIETDELRHYIAEICPPFA